MIESEFSNNKVTANQRAKQIMLTSLEAAFYFNDDGMTEKERELIIKFLDKHVHAICTKFNAEKLYKL